ncbi:MAG: phosphoribosylaminoimidazolesuccinocarboxamide synthase [Omnitrophica WOR_2 bacterium GWF2_43_52]|nr:MAG: phosphoribosylaminoimidazolesuccinocarboxamide synthase [Omnitrophica WOR_2 bacterium GWF2_43_52]OGX58370.1 MAG: phosphoribosylaminoimidazolesuccinocarboxamide synthase [Omnitrophica WOR_2 bacterium RIFOXYC2_FULL_43_9]HAH21193.1 phosphoribosylaminoimidazolesuccinocarboxamide synthase [Candidatus Omnitrophota bacterium]HBG63205.1 phosphoribosylaminoimidazolesuccinocarboxamide synthase [Candidatus Omnitrophota bacterium]
MRDNTLLKTEFKDLKLFRRGKVRDVYDLGDSLLIVATDRISCFDVVLPTPIPYKGIVLNQMSWFWFNFTKDIVKNHLLTAAIDEYPKELMKYRDSLEKRSMIVKKTKPLAIECIVRGYISGSAWKEYQTKGTACGFSLPVGLKESERLPQAIFTPSTKAEEGHDININEEEAKKIVGDNIFQEVKEKALAVYKKAAEHALTQGIIIADTKFEFGIFQNEIILIDEVLTPDSSRFWPGDTYRRGQGQMSFDKQFVRDYLESIGWDKNPPPPALPQEIVDKTSEKYLEAYQRLTGNKL